MGVGSEEVNTLVKRAAVPSATQRLIILKRSKGSASALPPPPHHPGPPGSRLQAATQRNNGRRNKIKTRKWGGECSEHTGRIGLRAGSHRGAALIH
jgi:hypothetical protein